MSNSAFEKLSVEKHTAMVDVNVYHVAVLASLMTPVLMKRNHRSAFITVASIAGYFPLAGTATYSATKGFV
jgi:short-subunit dehydrogenase